MHHPKPGRPKSKSFLPLIRIPISQGRLAMAAGLSKPTVFAVVKGRNRCSPESAKKLAAACERMGIKMSLLDWLYPEDSTSPYVINQHNEFCTIARNS